MLANMNLVQEKNQLVTDVFYSLIIEKENVSHYGPLKLKDPGADWNQKCFHQWDHIPDAARNQEPAQLNFGP